MVAGRPPGTGTQPCGRPFLKQLSKFALCLPKSCHLQAGHLVHFIQIKIFQTNNLTGSVSGQLTIKEKYQKELWPKQLNCQGFLFKCKKVTKRRMVSNALVESFKVTFAGIQGQSSLSCHNPSSEFAIWRCWPFSGLGMGEHSLTSQHFSQRTEAQDILNIGQMLLHHRAVGKSTSSFMKVSQVGCSCEHMCFPPWRMKTKLMHCLLATIIPQSLRQSILMYGFFFNQIFVQTFVKYFCKLALYLGESLIF